MSQEVYKKFKKILVESGASVNGICFQWMFDDDTAPGHKLLNWIVNNITHENYLNPTEQREYCELISAGDYLVGEELAEAIDLIEIDYPGIFDDLTLTDDSNNDLSDHIALLTTETESMRQCIDEYDNSTKAYENLKKLYMDSSLDLKKAEDDCNIIASNFQEAENELQYTMKQIQNLFDQAKSGSVFLNQMDIATLMQMLQSKCNNIKVYLECLFPYSEHSDNEKMDLMMLYERLADGFYRDMLHEAETFAWKSLVDELPLIYNKTYSIVNFEKDIERIEILNNNLIDEELNQTLEMKSVAEKYAMQLLMKVQYQVNECRLANRVEANKRLVEVESNFRDSMCIWEILWRMMSIEGLSIERVQSLYRDIQNEKKARGRDVLLRFLDLKKLYEVQSEDPYQKKNADLCKWCVELLENEGIKFKMFEENSNIVHIYNKLIIETQTEMETYRNKLNSTSISSNKLSNVILKENKQVMGAISKSPICISPIHYTLFNYNNELHELEVAISAAKNIYVAKSKSIKSSPILNAQRHLWVQFLCEPKKVLAVLNSIKSSIKNKGSF